jgi:cbb3-type cytochrome oxidase maturation protein
VSILFFLIPLGVLGLAGAVWAFVWAVDHDQFEDLDRAGRSILFDDDEEAADAREPRPPAH